MGDSADWPGRARTHALSERRRSGPAPPGAGGRAGSDDGLDNWIAASLPMDMKENVSSPASCAPTGGAFGRL